MSMMFSINNSPFFGREGKFVTSRHLRDRLMKETEKTLALRVEDTDGADSFLVFGRGILHLGILIETMRREGFELTVGNPQVLVKKLMVTNASLMKIWLLMFHQNIAVK